MKEIRKVEIVGMGALGLLYGQHMAKHAVGCSISYVMDRERLARHADTVFTVNGEAVTIPRIASEDAVPADLLIVAVKYTGLESALTVMAPCIDDHTIILSVLNGITSEDIIAERFGRAHMIYTVPQGMDAMKFGSALRYTQSGALHLGITDPSMQEDLDSVLRFFDAISMPYVLEEDILWRMWFKYMLNVGVNQICMVYDTTYAGVTNPGEPQDKLLGAMREVMEIANRKGIALTEQDMQTCIEIERTLDPDGTPSMGQDRINRRPSEVEMFAGTVMRLGRGTGVPSPVYEEIYRRVREIESAYISR